MPRKTDQGKHTPTGRQTEDSWFKSLPPALQVAIVTTIITLVGVLGAAFIGVWPQLCPRPTPTNTPTAALTPTPTSGNTLTPTPTSTPTITPTPTPTCPYQASTDAETITRLIQAEAQAVLDEDISIIRAIFAEDATIWDAARDERWEDPIARYAALFANTDFIEDVHFEVQPAGPGITENVAYFTSGSRVKFISVDDPSQTHEFDNPDCSEHWTFGRNRAGCWVITNFTFNACHIQFPP